MNANNILILGVTILVAVIGAFVLGESVASENYTMVAGITGGVILIGVIAVFKGHIWVLVPILFAYTGKILLLPLPFSVSNLVVMFVFVVIIGQIAIGSIQPKISFTKIEILGVLCLASVGLTFLLNPVGIAAIRSETVGSRPYFEVMLAVCGYLILATISPSLRVVKSLPIASLTITSIVAFLSGLAYFIPAVGARLYLIYTGFAPHISPDQSSTKREVARLRFLVPPGKKFMVFAMARSNAWRFSILGMGVTASAVMFHLGVALMSGHRLAIINWAAHIGIFILITRNFKLGFAAVFMAMMAFGGLYTYHHAVNDIPLSAQRAMSIIPGEWDYKVVQDAEFSTDWRLEMWEQALFDEGMIRNKVVGDGFGFSSDEMNLVANMIHESGNITSLSPEELAQYYLITGDLHSGPISAIKYVGVIGLIFFIMFATVVGWRYYKLCVRTRGSQLWIANLYFGVQAVWFPVSYIFLYGDYKLNLPTLIVSAGLLRLLEKAEQTEKSMSLVADEQSVNVPTVA